MMAPPHMDSLLKVSAALAPRFYLIYSPIRPASSGDEASHSTPTDPRVLYRHIFVPPVSSHPQNYPLIALKDVGDLEIFGRY